MKKFKIGEDWTNKIMPEGLLIPSSTLISGEGGSGKPLVGFSMISSWLKNEGNLVFVLTSAGKNFVDETMKEIYNVDIEDYKESLEFIEFDPSISPSVDSIEKTKEGLIKANLVNPEVWDEAIKIASENFKRKRELGTMVFASALNLFLFSKTYGDKILEKFRRIIKEEKTKTYFFTVSTTAYRKKIEILENVADNLMFTRVEKPMKLFIKITRAKNVNFSGDEIEVPLKTKDLKTIKNLAEQSRKDLIPIISKV